MLRDRAWQGTGDLTRAQLVMFRALGDQIHLSEEDRRRALNLDDRPHLDGVGEVSGGWSTPRRTGSARDVAAFGQSRVQTDGHG
jgi:hypothetical protein